MITKHKYLQYIQEQSSKNEVEQTVLSPTGTLLNDTLLPESWCRSTAVDWPELERLCCTLFPKTPTTEDTHTRPVIQTYISL